MGRPNMYENVDDVTRQEIINMKRLITVAGEIQDRIADDVKTLDDLKKEIKSYEMTMATTPETDVTLVSGTHVAILSAEAKQREKGPDINRTVFGLLGIDKFLEIATLPVPATKKALGVEQYEAVCPAFYNGTGRRFTLKKKS